MVSLSVVVCFALLALAAATNVQQCPGRSIPDLSDNVHLSCKKVPCSLKKNTNQHITINFTPEEDMDVLTNHVTADVLGVELPFVGVDGLSICDKIFLENGEKASCPLKGGTRYSYKDSFPILSFYPSINVKIHWSLLNNKNDVVCFEVPAKIVSGPKQ